MANPTLSELRTLARQKADKSARSDGGGHVTDTELNGYINAAGAELWDMLVTVYEDHFTRVDTITSVTPVDVTDWATLTGFTAEVGYSEVTLFKLRGVDWYDSGVYRPLVSVGGNEWAAFSSESSNQDPCAYTLLDELYMLPTDCNYPASGDGSSRTFRVRWIPSYRAMTADASEMFRRFDVINKWEEYIAVRAAIEMLRKEESDVSALAQERERLEMRIRGAAQNRSGGPRRIADARGRRDLDPMYPRGRMWR